MYDSGAGQMADCDILSPVCRRRDTGAPMPAICQCASKHVLTRFNDDDLGGRRAGFYRATIPHRRHHAINFNAYHSFYDDARQPRRHGEACLEYELTYAAAIDFTRFRRKA